MDSEFTSPYRNQMAAQQLLQGINSMQMQAGLMPGGYGGGAPPIMAPPPRVPTPSDFSSQLRVNFSSNAAPAFTPLPMPMPGGVTPMQQPYLPGFSAPPPTPQQFSMGMAMQARQYAAGHENTMMAMSQGALGLGARAMGNMAAFAMGGPLGMLGFEALGLGQTFNNMGAGLMTPLINRRRADLEIQNASLGFVRGGQDLSAMGMGLSATAASNLRSGLTEMAGSSTFRANTYNMFNQADVMKITRMSGQLGMLDQSQTADQMRNEIGRISRALANFIKIAEEPDMQRALGMMSGLRNMGYSTGEMTSAALQARHFARMAGTDVGGIMDAGMRGSAAYTARGLSGAAGMGGGMASAAMAAQLGSLMSPNRLALAGGVEGIAASLASGGASTTTLGAILPAMLTGGGPGGRIRVDRASVMDLVSGRLDLSQLMRRSGGRAQRFGAEGMSEIVSRQTELTDELVRTLGPEASTLMPLILANSARSMMPGLGLRERLMAVSGMDERAASDYTRMVRDPRFMANLQQQMDVRSREEMGELRRRIESREAYASVPELFRNLERSLERLATGISRSADSMVRSVSRSQDIREQIALAGGEDRVLRVIGRDTDVTGSALTRNRARDLFNDTSVGISGAEMLDMANRRMAGEREAYNTYANLSGFGTIASGALMLATGGTSSAATMTAGAIARSVGVGIAGSAIAGMPAGMYGSEGLVAPFGMGNPRSRFVEETLNESEGLLTRLNPFLRRYTPGEVERRSSELIRSGLDIGHMGSRSEEAARVERGRLRTFMAERGYGTPEASRRLLVAAGRGFGNYMTSITGPVEGITGPLHRYEESARNQAMIANLIREGGVSAEEATRLVENETFRRTALGVGRAGMGAEERARTDRVVTAGGDVNEALDASMISAIHEQAQTQYNDVLRGFGGESDWFDFETDMSTEGRNRVAEFLGSARGAEGMDQQVLNLAFLEKALEAAINEGRSPEEVARLQQQVVAMRETINPDPDQMRRARMMVDERFGDDTDTLARVGEAIATNAPTIEGAMQYLERGKTGMEAAGIAQASEALVAVLGREAGSEVIRNRGDRAGQYRAIREHLANNGIIRGLSEEDRATILADETGTGAGGRLVSNIVNRAILAGRRGVTVESATGVGTEARARISGEGAALLNNITADIDVMDTEELSAAMAGNEGAVTATPSTFEEAVGIFGTASQALLNAANAMRGMHEVADIRNHTP